MKMSFNVRKSCKEPTAVGAGDWTSQPHSRCIALTLNFGVFILGKRQDFDRKFEIR